MKADSKRLSGPVTALLLGLFSATSSAGLLNAEPPPGSLSASRVPPPGEGMLCLWGLTVPAAEIGRRCRAGQNPAFQAELERTVSRLDDYALANGLTAEQVTQFKRQQSLADRPEGGVCTNELLSFYDHMAARGAEALRSAVDQLVSRPGRPTWGDCL